MQTQIPEFSAIAAGVAFGAAGAGYWFLRSRGAKHEQASKKRNKV